MKTGKHIIDEYGETYSIHKGSYTKRCGGFQWRLTHLDEVLEDGDCHQTVHASMADCVSEVQDIEDRKRLLRKNFQEWVDAMYSGMGRRNGSCYPDS